MKPDCRSCGLKAMTKPIKTYIPKKAKYAFVVSYPSQKDSDSGSIFSDSTAGICLNTLINKSPFTYDDAVRIPVISCSLPGDNLNLWTYKEGQKDLKSCLENCQPRFLYEVSQYDYVICFGAEAARAIRGRPTNISDVRGSGEVLDIAFKPTKVFYMNDPRKLARSVNTLDVPIWDINKAYRYFSDTLSWADMDIQNHFSLQDWVSAVESLPIGPIVYDVETDAIDPLNCTMRCIGYGNESTCHVLAIHDMNGDAALSDADMAALPDTLKYILKDRVASKGIKLYGHNAGQYDELAVQSNYGFIPQLYSDSMVEHNISHTGQRHGLGTCVSSLTDDVEPWKEDHTAVNAQNLLKLMTYCGKDCIKNARIVPIINRRITSIKCSSIIPKERWVQKIGTEMQRGGQRIDFDALAKMTEEYSASLVADAAKLQELQPVNPNSPVQLRKLFYDAWDLYPEVYSDKTGLPSTSAEAVKGFLKKKILSPTQLEYVNVLRRYKKTKKIVSTYLKPIGILAARDGKLHSRFSRLPATGRYSSSDPNVQNWMKFLRKLVVADPGHVLIGADSDQLELRGIAEESNAKNLLTAINKGLCPHNETMSTAFGKDIWQYDGAPKNRTDKGSGKFFSMRQLMKITRYSWQYAAGLNTVGRTIWDIEDKDKDGNSIFPFAGLSRRRIRELMKALETADPEIPEWWDEQLDLFGINGYSADTLWGRRRYMAPWAEANKIVNHPIQAGGAAIVHEAMIHLILGYELDWFCTTSTLSDKNGNGLYADEGRIVLQCHDQLIISVPENRQDYWLRRMLVAMNRRRRNNPKLDYTAGADAGRTWKEVE